MDIVYILKKGGSHWQDNELRYSLRSLNQNVKDFNKVFVIGHKPPFLSDKVIHIPHEDVYTNKARNIMAKVNRAAEDTRISNDFMLWNDDYYAMQPFSAKNYPYYFKCDLEHTIRINMGEYKMHSEATLKILKSRNLAFQNFDTHYPIIYNKTKLKKMVKAFDWNVPFGFILRSMYCNFYSISGEFKLDCKTNSQMARPHIAKIVEQNHFMSIGDNALNAAFREYLVNKFPIATQYEL